MSERIIAGRAALGPGGQHVNDGSESAMILVIDDEHRLGAYCATERSQRANITRARILLAQLKDDPKWYAVVDAAIAQYEKSKYARVGRDLDAAREAHDAWRMATVATDAAVAALLGETP